MEYENLMLKQHDHVAHVQLNRPDVINALNKDMVQEFYQCIGGLGQDADVRVIVLSGSGRGFCAGGDVTFLEVINSKEPREVRQFLVELFDILSIVARVETPVIGALHGFVLGAGFGLSLLCDVRVAGRGTIFGPEFAKMGLVPELGVTHILPRLVGLGRAMEVLLTARRFGAEEAEKLGLVNKVVPDERVVEEAMEMARAMAFLPPVAVGMTKTALQKGAASSSLHEAHDNEATMNAVCYKTEDHTEAVKAFLDKRTPVFKGR